MQRRRFSTLIKATVLGLLTAAAGLPVGITPLGLSLEEDIGLSWLFKVRGPRAAPPEVMVISIDRESARRLDLPNAPRKWPRALHAALVRSLAEGGAAVIAFDIIFDESRNAEHDRVFGEAIRQAGNVVLFEYLRRETLALRDDSGGSLAEMDIEQRVPPIPVLAGAALGLAPFPLPKVPAKVSQFWLFKSEGGKVPTLPVTAFQVFALSAYDSLLAPVSAVLPREAVGVPPNAVQLREQGAIHRSIGRLRQLFLQHPQLGKELSAHLEKSRGRLSAELGDRLESLIGLYAGNDSRYLNYYGPPHSIRTVPYHRLLNFDASPGGASGVDVRGKAVFVGFSEQLQPEQKDGFYTVFSRDSGLDISGVEIAATAFANLLERRPVRLLDPLGQVLVLALWGLAVGGLLRLVPGLAVIPAALGMSALYASAAYYLFARDALWLPLVVPLLWQLPLATLGALLWRYVDARAERANIRRAFGYHLPDAVVERLAAGIDDIGASGQQLYGICLATDAANYTALSERLTPGDLQELMNRYLEVIFAPIRRRGGVVSDVAGDSTLAIWASSHPDARLREQACLAALEISEDLDEFNRTEQKGQLPTRFGLHCGEVLMGHVGAIDHYEYRAVGGIVSAASRLEGLNKRLGTRLLVSKEMMMGLKGFAAREIGHFILAGTSQPLTVLELLSASAPNDGPPLSLEFGKALGYFRAGHWDAACESFERVIELFDEDPPSRFYSRLCKQYQQDPPGPDWDGVVRMKLK